MNSRARAGMADDIPNVNEKGGDFVIGASPSCHLRAASQTLSAGEPVHGLSGGTEGYGGLCDCILQSGSPLLAQPSDVQSERSLLRTALLSSESPALRTAQQPSDALCPESTAVNTHCPTFASRKKIRLPYGRACRIVSRFFDLAFLCSSLALNFPVYLAMSRISSISL